LPVDHDLRLSGEPELHRVRKPEEEPRDESLGAIGQRAGRSFLDHCEASRFA
jgi:hypothetical protein